MSDEHIDPTKEQFKVFQSLTREGPIHMLNLVRLQAAVEDSRLIRLAPKTAGRTFGE